MKDNRTEDKRSQPPIKKQKKPQAHAQSYAQSHAQSHTQSSFKSFFKSSVKPLFKFPFKLKEAALKEHPKSHIPEPHTKAHIKAHTTEAYKTEAGPKNKAPKDCSAAFSAFSTAVLLAPGYSSPYHSSGAPDRKKTAVIGNGWQIIQCL